MNKTDFKNKLKGVITSAKNQRDNIQELIVAGIEQYEDSGRTTFLSDLLAQTVAVKSLPTVTIKDFIKEHTDLAYRKNKAGEYMFVRADKEAEKVVKLVEVKWYDWKKAKHNNVKEVDHKKLAIKHLKAINDGKHSAKYLMETLVESGFTTSQLLKMIDSVSLQAVDKAA
jgi:hypothetical protein